MRILLLSNMGPSKSKPNSGRFIYNQYLALKKVLGNNLEFFYLEQATQTGVARMFRYPKFFVRFLSRYVFSLNKLDIIHVHFYFPNILLAIAYKLLRNWRVKIVVTFHGSDIYLYSPPNIVYKACTHFIDQYIFVSEKLKQRFFKNVPCRVLSAGVNDIFYQQRSHCDANEKQFDIVFVGHLDKNKGIARLEEILLKFPSKIRMAIVGAGNEEFINRVKSCHHVSLSYYESRTPEQLVTIYNASYLLINLSYNESFGLVMSEAMACGAVVVATHTDGASAQIVNASNGFLIANQDDTVCSSAINAISHILTMSHSEYASMSKNAVNTAEQYRLSLVTEQILNIYTKLNVSSIND
jgi:L-malate glycosyltransferase